MDTMHLVLSVLQVIACVLLIVTVLMQEGSNQGANSALSGSSETFFGTNKATGFQAVLVRTTTVLGICFAVFSAALNLL